ncbi:MAG: hypothetical protein J5507_06440 [Clostridia bacterium]|nr:hypothetical protein [Clostridia bacterium]
MKNLKTQNGITLIALIITIIVMLILVGVTINVALNGGLFEKADNAKNLTQKETDKEMLLSAVVATVDGSGNFHLDQLILPEDFTYNSTTKVYKSKTGNEFIINETTGKIEEYTETEQKQLGSIYDVAYVDAEGDGVYVFKNHEGIVTLYTLYYEDGLLNVSESERTSVSIGDKFDYENDIKTDFFPGADFETEIRDEVIVDDDEIWMVFRISNGQEILSDGKDELIRNERFDISGIDFSNIIK